MKANRVRLRDVKQEFLEFEQGILEMEHSIFELEQQIAEIEPTRPESDLELLDLKKKLLDAKAETESIKAKKRQHERSILRLRLFRAALVALLILIILTGVAIFAFANYYLVNNLGFTYSTAIPMTGIGMVAGLVTESLVKWRKRRGTSADKAAMIRPPLYQLDRIARFLWSAKTYERVFAPVKADIVHEWMEAEVAGQSRKAWFIKWIRGPLTQLSHMANQVRFSIAKRVVEMFQASR